MRQLTLASRHALLGITCVVLILAQVHAFQEGGSTPRTVETRQAARRDGEKYVDPAKVSIDKLAVRWGAPGYKGDAANTSHTEVTLSGTITIAGDVQGKLLPFQVVMSRRPSVKPEWSKGHELESTISANVTAERAGVKDATFPFSIAVPLHRILTSPAKDELFQVGVSLANVTDTRVEWTNAQGVLPQSVQMVPVRGSSRLSTALQLINLCSDPLDTYGDPSAIVNAVNFLRDKGKEGAIEALEEYLRIASPGGRKRNESDLANPGSARKNVILTIVPVLFSNCKFDSGITVHKDLPVNLRLPVGNARFGEGTADRLLALAKEHGVMLDRKLSPPDDPITVIEELYEKLIQTEEYRSHLDSNAIKLRLRRQALILAHSSYARDPFELGNDSKWSNYVSSHRLHELKWDKDRYAKGAPKR
jgi:hypothetical protein